eukprot:GHVR01011458.1.p1 GENE.GHVR01011458.1~~GHVR01011458.1.p1  ORF type:complete len:742 (+),score=123.76 GHVR01011458.1:20-2245(+)
MAFFFVLSLFEVFSIVTGNGSFLSHVTEAILEKELKNYTLLTTQNTHTKHDTQVTRHTKHDYTNAYNLYKLQIDNIERFCAFIPFKRGIYLETSKDTYDKKQYEGCSGKVVKPAHTWFKCTNNLDNNNEDKVNKPDDTGVSVSTANKSINLVLFKNNNKRGLSKSAKGEIINKDLFNTNLLIELNRTRCNCVIGTLDMYSPESIFFDKVFEYKMDTDENIIQTITSIHNKDKPLLPVTTLHVDNTYGLNRSMTLNNRSKRQKVKRRISFDMNKRKSSISLDDLYEALPIRCKGESNTDGNSNWHIILNGILNHQLPNYSKNFLNHNYVHPKKPLINSLTRTYMDKFWGDGGCAEHLQDFVYSASFFNPSLIHLVRDDIHINIPLVDKDLFTKPDQWKPMVYADPWQFVLHSEISGSGSLIIGTQAIKDNAFNSKRDFLHFYHQHTHTDILHRDGNDSYRVSILKSEKPVQRNERYLLNIIERELIDTPLIFTTSIKENINTFSLKIFDGKAHTCVLNPTSTEINLLYAKELTKADGCKKLVIFVNKDKSNKVIKDYESTTYECWMNKQKQKNIIKVFTYPNGIPEDILKTSFPCNCIIGTAGHSLMFYDKVLKFSKFNEKVKHTQDTQENKIEEETKQVIKAKIVPRDEYTRTHTHTHTSVYKPKDNISTVLYTNYYTGHKSKAYLKDFTLDKFWRTMNKGIMLMFNFLRVKSSLDIDVLKDQLPSVCESQGECRYIIYIC